MESELKITEEGLKLIREIEAIKAPELKAKVVEFSLWSDRLRYLFLQAPFIKKEDDRN